jgi:tRNA(Ile)-lysidine synthase
VSGGGDSLALLMLLLEMGRPVVAGIVDHGLREGSDLDARRAAGIAESLGAKAHVLTLCGLKAGQAAAREARYAALAGLARRIGARTLYLGHTADDQAETIFMRREAGSGARGLAGMAALSPCPVWPEGRDLDLARPLLEWRRAELRRLLRDAGVGWIEDPANGLLRYARVRARATLARGGGEALLEEAARAADAAARADREALGWLQSAALEEDTADLPAGAPPRALAALTAAYGGARREPAPSAVERMLVRGRGALAGARLEGGGLTRDPGGVLGRRGGVAPLGALPLPEGQPVVWDYRLEITALVPGLQAHPPRRGGPLRPEIDGPARLRWLPATRVRRLLWRASA